MFIRTIIYCRQLNKNNLSVRALFENLKLKLSKPHPLDRDSFVEELKQCYDLLKTLT